MGRAFAKLAAVRFREAFHINFVMEMDMLKLFVKSQVAIEDFKKNIEGASLIEYSLLIGLITAAVVATIALISPKVLKAWTDLNTAWK